MKKNLSNMLNESVVSMLLGALVVVLVGLLAYNFFKNRQTVNPTTPIETEQSEQALNGELATPAATVKQTTVYTVVSGDSLWSIAEKFYGDGHKYGDLAKINNISNPRAIEVGQKITIQSAENQSAILGSNYTVGQGDSLWQISVRAYGDGFRWTDISKANNLVHPALIHAGNVLVIPRP